MVLSEWFKLGNKVNEIKSFCLARLSFDAVQNGHKNI